MYARTLGPTQIPASTTYVQLGWYFVGAATAFLIPFVFSSLLDLNHDLYYLAYFASTAGFLWAYATATDADVVGLFTRHWRWSVTLGLVAAAFVVWSVLTREDSTPHPEGVYFGFSIFWRGLVYGAIDALLLTAFPVAVAFALMSRHIESYVRRATFALLGLILVLVITAVYHLGYEQFREDGVAGPETGNTIISVPALLTANPLGSVIAHASMHVSANVHAYETDLFLPPQTFVEGNEEEPESLD
jgi:hypothetical protein